MILRGAPGAGQGAIELSRRLRWALLVVGLVFLLLAGRLWQLQVVRGDTYFQRTVSNVVHERYLPSVRGKILDRAGVPLAANRPAYSVYVVPRQLTTEARAELVRLLGLTDEEVGKVDERIAGGKKRSAGQPVLVLEDQGRDRAALIEQARFRLPGVEVRHEPYRTYPQGDLAAHAVGYMTQMTSGEFDRLAEQGYAPDELVGRYGLEAAWDNYLRGTKGIERYAVDARGQRLDEATAAGLIKGERVIAPVPGANVITTLDATLQRLAERAVAPHQAAAVVAIEVGTGKVRALVSKPSFDPNVMTGHLTRAEEALLTSDPRKPFIDKTLRATYPPGSVFKFVTAIAALEDGQAAEDEPIFCTGSYELAGTTFRCTSSHERLDLVGAIQHSCNVYFWKLAERVGIDRLAEVARAYGFGAPTNIGLGADAPGRIPTKAWYEQRTRYKVGYATNAATGQGDVEVTVLQVAMAYAALVDGGNLYVPQLVERVEAADGRVLYAYEPKIANAVRTPPDVLDLLHRGMVKVVGEAGGTAYEYARSEVVTIAGKSGTAEVRKRPRKKEDEVVRDGWHPTQSHAWFAGYAPADAPELVVVVLIEHGGSGGKVAGPVARSIIEGYFQKVRPGASARASRAGTDEAARVRDALRRSAEQVGLEPPPVVAPPAPARPPVGTGSAAGSGSGSGSAGARP
ncbi:MAG: penicillin-binding protein 2 [Kofleriaceae bacterium]|nr:penicillin-binding protein 2 [Kofleriaceae bacterium]MBP6839044.1 penicillin-binding protein 2 [Kofleriaceae bacterium]